jgi:hypothetical protein
VADHRAEVDLRGDEQPRLECPCALGAKPDLRGRLLARDVERVPRRADPAATSRSSVDLPTPASPASNSTAPEPSRRRAHGRARRPRWAGTPQPCARRRWDRGARDRTRPSTRTARGTPISSTVPHARHRPRPTRDLNPSALGAAVGGTLRVEVRS